MLETARLSPSACNLQPWRFIVIRNVEVKTRLRAAYDADWFVNAPIIIVACAVPKEAWRRADGEEYWKVDVAIAMQSLILVATELGLGTCWIASFNEKKTKKVLGIPSNWRVLAMTPLGYPAEEKGEVINRKPIQSVCSFFEQ